MRSRRIDHKDDTRLAVDAEEQRAVQERLNSGNAASTPTYHFICECFFLTAKGLHLGLIKIIQDLYNLARVSRCPTSYLSPFLYASSPVPSCPLSRGDTLPAGCPEVQEPMVREISMGGVARVPEAFCPVHVLGVSR